MLDEEAKYIIKAGEYKCKRINAYEGMLPAPKAEKCAIIKRACNLLERGIITHDEAARIIAAA